MDLPVDGARRHGPDPDAVVAALAQAAGELPGGGEDRPGQREMAVAVARALGSGRHLVVQAGTGTGKSLAYLIPALVSERTTVVATATKNLQDQLAKRDLPFLAETLAPVLGRPVSHAVLKGRSNYVCRQRIDEVTKAQAQGSLEVDALADRAPRAEIDRLVEWSHRTASGERAELPFEPSTAAWDAVSVSSRDCPGASRCPQGQTCFAEAARAAAAEADVIVVNTHLYGLHVSSGGVLLPEHEIVVFDEAHQLEDTVADTAGLAISPGRFTALSRAVRAVVADPAVVGDLDATAARLTEALLPDIGRRLRGEVDGELADAMVLGRERVDRVLSALRAVPDDGPLELGARKRRAVKSATALAEELDASMSVPVDQVAWVEGPERAPSLQVRPIDVAGLLDDLLWPHVTAVLTSATIPPSLPLRVGLADHPHDVLDVGSPFDYEANALLYCAAHLPDPRDARFDPAVHDELEALVTAAGGRTLALFTSHRACAAAVTALRERLPYTLLAQGDLPKPALLDAFAADEATCLFATMGFWQGIDVPGPTLSLVTIDRLPFPRPDEPLLQARRERARAEAFRLIDLPRAITLLAQGAGRLIRSDADRGVVAVLDPRLATNTRYRWDIVRALPPMRRTRDRQEAEAFLRSLRSGGG